MLWMYIQYRMKHIDLEVKDRRPYYIPKEGDWVKIKSLEWYNCWVCEQGVVNTERVFNRGMSRYCGLTMKVASVIISPYSRMLQFRLEGVLDIFTMDMFEETFPKDSYTADNTHKKTTFKLVEIPAILTLKNK